MNILDGVRHVNQSVMQLYARRAGKLPAGFAGQIFDFCPTQSRSAGRYVGEVFGANGVEIDAHPLCAEDHLPYQGKQFSNEDFEKLQSSLPRPFGEWNCRHTWSPIILGISRPRYTDGELQEMNDYSEEEIEIDGKVKSRYQWSTAVTLAAQARPARAKSKDFPPGQPKPFTHPRLSGGSA